MFLFCLTERSRQCMYSVMPRRVSARIVVVEKKYSECVSVALGIKRVVRMRRITTCGLTRANIYCYIIS